MGGFYNKKPLYSAIDYRSPADFEPQPESCMGVVFVESRQGQKSSLIETCYSDVTEAKPVEDHLDRIIKQRMESIVYTNRLK